MSKPTVLIVGASGLVGTAAANAFIRAGWQVVAASRRRPELIDAGPFEHIALDLREAQRCADACQRLENITHVVYTAVYEMPGLIEGWSDPHQIETNGQMLRNLLDPLCAHASLKHVTILQGTKAYGSAVRPMRVPARESQPRVEHPNFYWLHEDYIADKSSQSGFEYTILRPQLIVGPNHGVVMNLPPVIGVYAAIRHFEGKPFSYPGGADWVWEAADAQLVGNACVWAAINPVAAGEAYNLTNGEVFMWRDLWPALAATLGVQVGEDEPLSIAKYLSDKSDVWEAIVHAYDLREISLENLLGESHHYADLCFAAGTHESPAPVFVSTVKIKQAGFTETCNSEESFCHWLRDLQRRRILPTFQANENPR